MFDSGLRVEQNLENYSETFSSRSRSSEPPCVTLYDTFQLLGIGINQWFKSPPVANNICALYESPHSYHFNDNNTTHSS